MLVRLGLVRIFLFDGELVSRQKVPWRKILEPILAYNAYIYLHMYIYTYVQSSFFFLNDQSAILVKSPHSTKRCIHQSSLNIALVRQPSTYVSQNVKKHEVHAPALGNESILVKINPLTPNKINPEINFFFPKKIYT